MYEFEIDSRIWDFTYTNNIYKFLQNPGDVDREIDKLREIAVHQGMTVQPYLLIVGNVKEVKSVFIVIDNITYKGTSFLHSLQLLYKIYHVFNIKYPCQSNHIWYVIQKCLFDMTTPYDSSIPYVMDIVKQLTGVNV